MLLVFEILRNVKGLANLARVTDSFTLSLVNVFLTLLHLVSCLQFESLLVGLLLGLKGFLFQDSGFLTTDLSKTVKDARKKSALHGSVSELEIIGD